MSDTSCLSHPIQELDLTSGSELRSSQIQKPHLNAQLCEQNRSLGRKNKTADQRRNVDSSSRVIEQHSASMDPEDRTRYSDRDDQVDEEHTDQDYCSDADGSDEYDEPRLVMKALKGLEKGLGLGDTAIKDIETEMSSALHMLMSLLREFPPIKPFGPRPKFMPPMPRESFHDLVDEMDTPFGNVESHLKSLEESHQEAKQELDSLKLSVRSLLKDKAASAESEKRRKAADEEMFDSIKFLKECLANHSRLVDIVLGRPEPLVKQGMKLMQNLLDEMFGLAEGDVQDFMQISEADVQEEVENNLELQLASESDSEAEFLWEQTHAQDLMDDEASEASESESDGDESDNTSEGSDEYCDDSNSDCFDYSATISNEYKRILRKTKEKRKKAKTDRNALWRRFGLRVEDAGEDQTDISGEERRRTKRQKRSHDAMEEERVEDKLIFHRHPPDLRQTTLNFDKVTKNRGPLMRRELKERQVTKNRRLFSRRELVQQGILEDDEQEEEH